VNHIQMAQCINLSPKNKPTRESNQSGRQFRKTEEGSGKENKEIFKSTIESELKEASYE
jgi:hypothetical protein